MAAREELRLALERQQVQKKQDQEVLVTQVTSSHWKTRDNNGIAWRFDNPMGFVAMNVLALQIEDLRMSISRSEKESGRREDVLRQEISDLQQVDLPFPICSHVVDQCSTRIEICA